MKVVAGGWDFQLNVSLDPLGEVMLFFLRSSLLVLYWYSGKSQHIIIQSRSNRTGNPSNTLGVTHFRNVL
jgi:hypothetical protein